VGRDFYEGSDSRAYLHGSTGMWEALTYLDEAMTPAPWLAESWESLDSHRTWVFRLRDKVLFHDGSTMSAQDVVASMKRLMKNPRYDPSGSLSYVESVSAKGDRVVAFKISRPLPHFPKLVAYYGSPVFKRDCFDDAGRIKEPVATGPYRVKEVLQGSRLSLSAFKGHWAGTPPYDEIVFMTIPDAQTRAMALISGKIGAIADVGGILPEQEQTFRREPEVLLKRAQVATTHILLFNCARPPFSYAQARRWFSGMIDRGKLIDVFAKGAGIAAADPYTPLAREYAFGLIRPSRYPIPPEAMNYREIMTIILQGATLQRWPYKDMAQTLQGLLLSNGLKAEIRIMEQGAFQDAIKAGRFHMALQPYTLMTGDPDFFYSYWILSDAPRNCGWRNPDADRLINEARHETVRERRKDTYRRLQEMLSQDLPLLPLYHDVAIYAHRKDVRCLQMDHFFKPVLKVKGCE
jgi:peptide/nickel transport system substrate-binding protein